jgi:LysR family transcriptional regulator, hydrogen peroxide-inducible genes activator
MTLTDLKYIVALARTRHFGRAAESCFVAQPTLSVAVKKLEDQLGIALFERAPGEVRPTEIGVQVIAQAERTLAEAARVAEIAMAGKDPLAGPLRLGVIPTIGPYLLPTLVPLLKERAPEMPLMLVETYTHELIAKVKNSELDLIIIALPCEEPGLVAQPVYDEDFRVLLPKAHPWAKESGIKADNLLDQPLLMLGAGNCFRDQVLDLCTRASNAPSPQVLEGSSLETIRLMVASGLGITVMPASAVDPEALASPLLTVKPFADPTPHRRVGLVWRSSFPRSKAVDLVREAVLDCHLAGTTQVGRRGVAH